MKVRDGVGAWDEYNVRILGNKAPHRRPTHIHQNRAASAK